MHKEFESEKYPELIDLFTRCFHPEWREDFEKEDEVIVDFAKYQKTNQLLDILLEIEELKKEFSEDEKLKCIIEDDLGLGYGLGIYLIGMTAFQWLDLVSSTIKEELKKRKK